jgi:2-dehydro-3-deoxy-D-gluconate 5-dehydrogenase
MTAGPFGLAGKVAIVTGGNGGIGLGMARGLATAGAAIAIVGRNEAKSAEAVAGLMKDGNKAIAVAADVTDEAAVGAMVTRVRGELGRIDILVNNAGINIRKPPESLDPAEWDSVIRTNLTSAFLCSRAVHPAMKATGGGKIINIGSMMSIFGASFAPAYAASKGGIVQFTRSCAVAWAADNIQRGAAGMDRHRSDKARPRTDRRLARQSLGTHTGGALGLGGRLCRHRDFPCLARFGFRHRHRDPGRWRLFDHGLSQAFSSEVYPRTCRPR